MQRMYEEEVVIPEKDLPETVPSPANQFHYRVTLFYLFILMIVFAGLATLIPSQMTVQQLKAAKESWGVSLVSINGRIYDVSNHMQYEHGNRSHWVGKDVTYALIHQCFTPTCLDTIVRNTEVEYGDWQVVKPYRRSMERVFWIYGFLRYHPSELHSYTWKEQYEFFMDYAIEMAEIFFSYEKISFSSI